jgi:hypothetical protein
MQSKEKLKQFPHFWRNKFGERQYTNHNNVTRKDQNKHTFVALIVRYLPIIRK